MPDPAPIDGFSVYYDRHRRWWCWKERRPRSDWKKRGYRIYGSEYRNRAHAFAGVRLELQSRSNNVD